MKVLMLAPQPFFEPRGTPFSVLGRLRALSELGHEVDLLTYHVGQDVAIPRVRIYRTPRIGFIKRVKIGPSFWKPLLDLLLLVQAVRFLRKGGYDVVHTHEEASIFGMVLSRLFKLPHIYDMHSSLAEQLKNFKFTRLGALVRLFEWLERRVINSSDAVITICPALSERVRSINAHAPEVMIENVASAAGEASVSEAEARSFRSQRPWLEGKKVVLYTGTLEAYQGLDLLVASAGPVAERCKNVMFLIVGGRPEQVQHYQGQATAAGLADHFHFTGIRPTEEIPLYMEVADVLVSPRTRGTNTPLKIYSYLQSGKPVVATNLYTHTQVLNPDVAVLVAPDPPSLAHGLLSLLEDTELAATLGTRARQLFEAKYSLKIYLEKTQKVLELALR